MAESFLGALNLVVQTLGRLEDVVEAAVEDASGITAWGERRGAVGPSATSSLESVPEPLGGARTGSEVGARDSRPDAASRTRTPPGLRDRCDPCCCLNLDASRVP
jgi:hypothetical protein